ncbi:hypothetical protein [Candidatus Rhabdochlamydia sp. T3358]|uniref:hypothetical protein n=1 Tax=Candidatus Rhabdochlamydia sp. T3358 TaxID=2099795 RepID=UPI0010FE8542|nr:hypothetical protein [Candidatus Rhabdochlamydia sp. T3358]
MNTFSKNIRLRIAIIFLTCAVYYVTFALGCIPMPSANSSEDSDHLVNVVDPIELYFENFEILTKLEDWKEIIAKGKIALEFAKNANRSKDEATICAQLAFNSLLLRRIYSSPYIRRQSLSQIVGKLYRPNPFYSIILSKISCLSCFCS